MRHREGAEDQLLELIAHLHVLNRIEYRDGFYTVSRPIVDKVSSAWLAARAKQQGQGAYGSSPLRLACPPCPGFARRQGQDEHQARHGYSKVLRKRINPLSRWRGAGDWQKPSQADDANPHVAFSSIFLSPCRSVTGPSSYRPPGPVSSPPNFAFSAEHSQKERQTIVAALHGRGSIASLSLLLQAQAPA